MAIERSAASSRRPKLSLLVAVLLPALLLPAGCLSPPPSRESAPTPVPPPAAPAPAEAPPPEAPAAAAPSTTPANEGKASAGEAESETRRPGADDARRDRTAPARPAASKRAPSAAEEASADHLGGANASVRKPGALRAQLDRAERAATPDCPSARERKKAVCDLAGQICGLTDRDPNVASVAEYCADAKQRCSAAERRTAEHCPD